MMGGAARTDREGWNFGGLSLELQKTTIVLLSFFLILNPQKPAPNLGLSW